jgi:hypothetical protein
MYSHLSMVREPTTNDYKPQGTHKNLSIVSRIHELNSMERDPLKGEHYGISHQSARGAKKELHDLVEIGQRTCSRTNDPVHLLRVPNESGT